MLLSHISSIRNGSEYIFPCHMALENVFTEDSALWEPERFARSSDVVSAAPGKLYEYCDLNYVLLAEIIEKLSWERYNLYMRDHILQPLGIRGQFNPGLFRKEELRFLAPTYRRYSDGVFDVSQPWTAQMDDFGEEQPPESILHYNNPYKLGETLRQDDISNYIVGTNPSIFLPQGGLRASTEELMLFADMMLNGGVAASGERGISERSVCAMQTPVWKSGINGVFSVVKENEGTASPQCYCCGPTQKNSDYSLLDEPSKSSATRRLIGHTGAANRLKAECWWEPESKTAYAYAYTGVGCDPDQYLGKYGQTSQLQESTNLAICEFLYKNDSYFFEENE